MSSVAEADPYVFGNSKTWKNWQAKYKEPRTCLPCEEKHGKLYPFTSNLKITEHLFCRCEIVPMRTKQVGTVADKGFDGADAWLMYRGRLPDYYITKEEAMACGWDYRKKNLAEKCPGKMIGGNIYRNDDLKLPTSPDREWREADFDFISGKRNRKRMLYSNDGLIFVSYDHAQTFYEVVK